MVLAKVARRVKKFLRNDGRLERYVTERVEQRLAARTGGAGTGEAGDVIESFACGVEACVSAAEQSPHIGRDQGIGHAIKNGFAFDIAQVERASSVQVSDLMFPNQSANAGLARNVFESHKFHRRLSIKRFQILF